MENRVILLKSKEEKEELGANLFYTYKLENMNMKNQIKELKKEKKKLEDDLRLKENNRNNQKCCNVF